MRLVNAPSANWNARPEGVAVDCILLHATADRDTAASVAWCRASRAENPKPVSYHVIVDRDGTLYNLVTTDKRAWHAGGSLFGGRANVNDYSIGLSFANVNDGVESYPDVQLTVAAACCASWMRRYPAIALDRITTHAIVRAAWRAAHPEAEIKTDPAPPAFDLAAFKSRVASELTAPRELLV